MAVTPDKVQIGSSNDFLDGVAVDTAAGTGLFRETVVAADPENGEALARVRNTTPAVDDYGSVVRVAGSIDTGTWGYDAGGSGSVTIGAGKRVLQITAVAGGLGATLTINGGATVTIPALTSITIEPRGNLTAPALVFTDTTAYFVEHVN